MKKIIPQNPLILNKASQLFDNIFIKYLLSQLSSQQCPRERPGCLSQVLLKADCFISPLQKKNLITELTLHELGKTTAHKEKLHPFNLFLLILLCWKFSFFLIWKKESWQVSNC